MLKKQPWPWRQSGNRARPFRNLTVLSKKSFNPKIDQSEAEISFRMIRKWVLLKIIFGKLFLRKYLYL